MENEEKIVEEIVEAKEKKETYFRISYVDPNANEGKGATITDKILSLAEWIEYLKVPHDQLANFIAASKGREKLRKIAARKVSILKEEEDAKKALLKA